MDSGLPAATDTALALALGVRAPAAFALLFARAVARLWLLAGATITASPTLLLVEDDVVSAARSWLQACVLSGS